MSTLEMAEQLVDQLNHQEKKRLSLYLERQLEESEKSDGSWQKFWDIADELALEPGNGESPMKILDDMRR